MKIFYCTTTSKKVVSSTDRRAVPIKMILSNEKRFVFLLHQKKITATQDKLIVKKITRNMLTTLMMWNEMKTQQNQPHFTFSYHINYK